MNQRIPFIIGFGAIALLGTVWFTRYLEWQSRAKMSEKNAVYVRRDLPLLPKDTLLAYAPQTKKRFLSIRQLPENVTNVFLDSLNYSKGINLESLTSRERQEIQKQASMKPNIEDRDAPWFGGCTAGIHFLEAGETQDGWWIFYESGGIVDTAGLVLIAGNEGQPKIIATYPVKRPIPVYEKVVVP